MLDPSWVRTHADRFDVLHVHFGFDDRTPAELTALVTALRDAGRALVVTVHDLRNPHHADPAAHDAALGVLVPAAAALLTLTPGAAAEIARRWGREATVVPHPHVVPLGGSPRPAPRARRVRVGLHAKSVRANTDPAVVRAARGRRRRARGATLAPELGRRARRRRRAVGPPRGPRRVGAAVPLRHALAGGWRRAWTSARRWSRPRRVLRRAAAGPRLRPRRARARSPPRVRRGAGRRAAAPRPAAARAGERERARGERRATRRCYAAVRAVREDRHRRGRRASRSPSRSPAGWRPTSGSWRTGCAGAGHDVTLFAGPGSDPRAAASSA